MAVKSLINGQRKNAAGYLLLLACSAAKHKGRAPAIQLYDGVNYRVLRKALAEGGWPPGLVIQIISAKYGLLDGSTIIDNYDQRMSAEAARGMKTKVTAG